MSHQVFIVMLRRPAKNDRRSDPFWEFGSFGCTGCHGKNLLHPKNCQIRNGDRLAFVQGGKGGLRLLLVTPPVNYIKYPIGRIEVRWAPPKKPFCYRYAPPLFPSPPGFFPLLFASLKDTKGATLNAKFASRFRARAHALSPQLAREVKEGYRVAMAIIGPSGLIRNYADALPWSNFPLTLNERRIEYNRRRKALTRRSSAAAFRPVRTGYRLARTAGRRLKFGEGSTPWSGKLMRPAFV